MLEVVGARIIGGRIAKAAEIHHRSSEAETQCLTGLVEPVPTLVEGQIAFEGHNGTETEEEDRQITLHHSEGNAFATSSCFNLQSDHQETKDTHQG